MFSSWGEEIINWISDRVFDILWFLHLLLVPKKPRNLITLKKTTITISLWIVVLFGIGALVIEAKDSQNHWFSFLENILVGVVCSLLVVIVTVYLQFKNEQNERVREHNAAAYKLLFCIKTCLFDKDISIDKAQELFESIIEKYGNYCEYNLWECFFSVKRDKQFNELHDKIWSLVCPLYGDSPVRTLDEYKRDISPDRYNEACNIAITFATEGLPDYLFVMLYNRYKKLLLKKELTATENKEY